MADNKQPAAEMWAAWTRDAMRSYDAPDDISDDEIVDDMADVATQYADVMMDEFAERFGPDSEVQGGRTRRRKKRGGRRARDPEESDD